MTTQELLPYEKRIKELEDKVAHLEKSIENSAEFILEMVTSMGCRIRTLEYKLTRNNQ